MYCTSMHVCIINMFTGALTEQQCNGFSNMNLYICSGETTHYKHIIHTHDTHTSFQECAHEQTHINIKLIKSTYHFNKHAHQWIYRKNIYIHAYVCCEEKHEFIMHHTVQRISNIGRALCVYTHLINVEKKNTIVFWHFFSTIAHETKPSFWSNF